MARKKTKRVVDLTDEDSSEPQRKQPRLDSPSSSGTGLPTPSSQGSVVALSGLQSTPGTLQPSSSSRAGQSAQRPIVLEEDEPEALETDGERRDPVRELYGSLENKIVGVRFYNGHATPGETVVCHREPRNPYDANAIRVDNALGIQIGHIPRAVASKLAPYLDRGDIAIEAQLAGEKGFYDCPIRISVYGSGRPWIRPGLEQRLKGDKLLTATQIKQTKKANEVQREVQRATLGLKANRSTVGLGAEEDEPGTSMEELLQVSQAVNMRNGEDIAKTLAMDEEKLSKMPMAAQPAALKSELLPYQLQGLAWLMEKEKPAFPSPGSSDAVQLWKRDARGRYCNMATNIAVSEAPRLVSGGILADDMGLGKTIQLISLIVTGGPGPTLIVAPLTVMSNWKQQVERHVHEEHAPEVSIFHGTQRKLTAAQAKSGVVVTSYGTLATEQKSGKSALFSTKWRRVVLDEGHTIRNARTKAAEAACNLKAESHWVLSGTPIVNNVGDLHSMLKFLRITGGIEQPGIFNATVTRGLATGEQRSELILQSLMHDLCLRRNKEMKFVDLNLPPKTEYIHRITFFADERKKYDALLAEAKGAFEEYRQRSNMGQAGAFQGVLERLLRLRQTCCHWTLCRKRIDDLFKLLEGKAVVELTDENRAILQEALRLFVESQEDCCVCLDSLQSPVITHCKHIYCRECITTVIQTQHKCPMCRERLAEDQLVEPAPETSGEAEEDLDMDTKSSKTEALLKILQATLKTPESKVIIFSQWTSFLSVLQRQLDEAGYKYTRIDGSVKAADRDKAISTLETDPDTRILLASLGVCSVGLNLVAADTVILADSWWAPAIEDQAIDRVHRLGQKRPTTVWRLVMEDSVEQRVLDIQSLKRQLVSKAFQDKRAKMSKETRMADIMKLLG